jgi:hypothetical protein
VSTRLVRRWSHLERQTGGIGIRGGPGEAQIELDRRMIGERIKTVKARLEKVKRQHQTQRRAREKNGTFRVSLVGYTNAGKSTLFNALVKARAYAADQLFATLDTTTRSLWLQEAGRQVSLSDTVGFIRDLPQLVGLRATRGQRTGRCCGRCQTRSCRRVEPEIGAQDPQILVCKLEAAARRARAGLDRAAPACDCPGCSSVRCPARLCAARTDRDAAAAALDPRLRPSPYRWRLAPRRGPNHQNANLAPRICEPLNPTPPACRPPGRAARAARALVMATRPPRRPPNLGELGAIST